jgi:hypothetical protein
MAEASAPQHGEGFDESKVPEGPAGDWFYSGKDGAGLSNEQYDTMKQRWIDAGAALPWDRNKDKHDADGSPTA